MTDNDSCPLGGKQRKMIYSAEEDHTIYYVITNCNIKVGVYLKPTNQHNTLCIFVFSSFPNGMILVLLERATISLSEYNVSYQL